MKNVPYWICAVAISAATGRAQDAAPTVNAQRFATEVTTFIGKEITAHITDIKTLDPPQERVVGALTVGEYSWGTFMRAAAVYSVLSGETTVAGRDLPRFLGQAGLIEAKGGAKAFSQMYAALCLRHFGTDLKTNSLWQSLTPQEQAQWRSLLDPGRFYDSKTRRVIDLPENYFGVASRVATMDYQMGLVTDRTYVDDLLDQAAAQFVKGAMYSDDSPPTGRFDRYSQEYARYVYEAAENAGRKDIMAALEPTLKTQFRLWWDLLSEDGYGYPWGRSLGVISYMDTMEIVGFVAQHPQFRPAPLPQLASAYYAAWQSLMREYLPKRHLLDVFGFGHGHYSYINPDREWQQTTGFFGKAANANILFKQAMAAEKVTAFPAKLQLGNVARFEYFRKGDRPAGVWLVRQGALRFALPITTGTKPGVADYLAAPHGLRGFDVPAEQTVPAMVPYLELDDGHVYVAGDGADEIKAGPDGRSLTVTWRRWAMIGAKSGQLSNPGLTSEVSWALSGDSLIRSERIESDKPRTIRRLSVMFPSTADRVSTRIQGNQRIDRFDSPDGSIEVVVGDSTAPLNTSLRAPGDSELGRGSRTPIRMLLEWEARDVTIQSGRPLRWSVTVRATR
jgi:hypothetical protein